MIASVTADMQINGSQCHYGYVSTSTCMGWRSDSPFCPTHRHFFMLQSTQEFSGPVRFGLVFRLINNKVVGAHVYNQSDIVPLLASTINMMACWDENWPRIHKCLSKHHEMQWDQSEKKPWRPILGHAWKCDICNSYVEYMLDSQKTASQNDTSHRPKKRMCSHLN